jgi:hypothetical protein
VKGLPDLSLGESGWNVVLTTTHPLVTPGLRMGWKYTFAYPLCTHKYVWGFIFTFTQKRDRADIF